MARLRSAKYRSRSRNLHGILAALQASHDASGDDCRHLIFFRRLRKKAGCEWRVLDEDERIVPVIARSHKTWTFPVTLAFMGRLDDELKRIRMHGEVNNNSKVRTAHELYIHGICTSRLFV